MIQLINYAGKNNELNPNKFNISRLSSPKSLDEYDINLIDLSDTKIWQNQSQSYHRIDCQNDLNNIGVMIKNSNRTKIIIILPQELTFHYNYQNDKLYNNEEIKNIMDDIRKDILNPFVNLFHDKIIFENTRTKVGEIDIDASFYLDIDIDDTVLTSSTHSKKATTVTRDNLILTTLNLEKEIEVLEFLKEIKLINLEIEIPLWIKNLKMFDDEEQELRIKENNIVINAAQEEIYSANKTLYKNNEYKSILYTNGDRLVDVTFEILEELLDYDLSNFVDEKKEDFTMKFGNVKIIGEIKGVTSNLKSEHISQLDVHMQTYLDELQTKNIEEEVKSILIINHQRNKDLIERQPVNENQIVLAKRNGSLIIETHTLLKIFEDFRKDETSSTELKDILIEKVGLLEY